MLFIKFSYVLLHVKIIAKISINILAFPDNFITQLFFTMTGSPFIDILLLYIPCLLVHFEFFLVRFHPLNELCIFIPQLRIEESHPSHQNSPHLLLI
jgi:hypothetical protein